MNYLYAEITSEPDDISGKYCNNLYNSFYSNTLIWVGVENQKPQDILQGLIHRLESNYVVLQTTLNEKYLKNLSIKLTNTTGDGFKGSNEQWLYYLSDALKIRIILFTYDTPENPSIFLDTHLKKDFRSCKNFKKYKKYSKEMKAHELRCIICHKNREFVSKLNGKEIKQCWRERYKHKDWPMNIEYKSPQNSKNGCLKRFELEKIFINLKHKIECVPKILEY